ncbi:hypothetical protein SAMN05421881_10674 [Nitrosomonas halophila]|uniref:Uncharacterized protein n=1 Tax=Nitrosomonas halophila TaxID=44576 RepID=A0A1H3N263_9PROT|nr:hypothetical protein SAMN05421881_10674 [Nitrosomonas halophila]
MLEQGLARRKVAPRSLGRLINSGGRKALAGRELVQHRIQYGVAVEKYFQTSQTRTLVIKLTERCIVPEYVRSFPSL